MITKKLFQWNYLAWETGLFIYILAIKSTNRPAISYSADFTNFLIQTHGQRGQSATAIPRRYLLYCCGLAVSKLPTYTMYSDGLVTRQCMYVYSLGPLLCEISHRHPICLCDYALFAACGFNYSIEGSLRLVSLVLSRSAASCMSIPRFPKSSTQRHWRLYTPTKIIPKLSI